MQHDQLLMFVFIAIGLVIPGFILLMDDSKFHNK